MNPKLLATLFGLALLASPAAAHFPWLATDNEGRAILFFGESPAERNYHLPEAVEKAAVTGVDASGKASVVELPTVDSEGFIGRRSADRVGATDQLRASMTYGIYHGSKLTYYAQHESKIAARERARPSEQRGLAALRATLWRAGGAGVAARVLWEGEPLARTDVQLFGERGRVQGSAKTDEEGLVRFGPDQVGPGLNGLMVGHVEKSASGEIEGKPYTSASHYLTVTFHNAAEAAESKNPATTSGIPPLPEPIASFGAAVADGWLYVYSGHTGTAHAHSRENLSKHFVRARVDGSGGWEKLPMGPPLQGLAMVAHGGKVYRIGGLDARNAAGEEDDLHSVDSFACFDPAKKQWKEMPPLPNGRSSHNAVVIGDTLYVVGGWRLTGDSDGDWQAGALAYDLADPRAEWRKLPEPPFRRRALAVGHVDNHLVAIGGMTDDQEVTRETFLFNPATSEWSAGPELPGDNFHGFGLAAWNTGGVLYTGGMEGVLYRLNQDRSAWTKAADFTTARFFHQLLPVGDRELLAIAGADPDVGHVATIERLKP